MCLVNLWYVHSHVGNAVLPMSKPKRDKEYEDTAHGTLKLIYLFILDTLFHKELSSMQCMLLKCGLQFDFCFLPGSERETFVG